MKKNLDEALEKYGDSTDFSALIPSMGEAEERPERPRRGRPPVQNPTKRENKTRRCFLLMRPSIYEQAQERVIELNLESFNEYVSMLIEKDLKKRGGK